MSVTDKSVWMQKLTWEDIEQYIQETNPAIAIVPIGSTEQHGPHLPLGVDAQEAIDVAEAIAEEAGIITAPPIWYGDAGHHMAFPGTIALSPETVISVLEDVYESLIYHGITDIITVNGHRMANLPTIDTATKDIKAEYPETFFGTIDLVRVAADAYNELREGEPNDGMHGGEFETSHMMAKHPDLVREENVVRETADGWTRFSSSDYTHMHDSVSTASSRHDWPEDALGHHGDPTLASAEKGEQLINEIVSNGVEFLEDLRAKHENGGGHELSY